MKASEIRQRFIDFFVNKYDHKQIPSASVVPENDPTVLFTTAGMQPLVPFFLGEKHPMGSKLVNSQKCIRTDDIEEVGDDTHCTFFEMLGNWSLGDYFKEQSIKMSYDLLTTSLADGGFGLDANRLRVTCFEGDADAPRDEEAANIWKELGFKEFSAEAGADEKRLIYFYEKKKNWWGPAGATGPCGPDTEIFYDRFPELNIADHAPEASQELIDKYPLKGAAGKCHPNCECGRYVEIWNNVFMQFNKDAEGKFTELAQKNVDTGMGLERITAILNEKWTHYDTDLFSGVKENLLNMAKVDENLEAAEVEKSLRIIADHLRAAVFILGDKRGVFPSNKDQGYILRRLIRRAIRHGKKLNIEQSFTNQIAEIFIEDYQDFFTELTENRTRILEELQKEEDKFKRTLEKGLREMKKVFDNQETRSLSTEDLAQKAFFLYETYGFPVEMIMEELDREGFKFDHQFFDESFKNKFKAHQNLSKLGAEQKFSGGLADHSEETTKLHTATHLLHQALKLVLGHEVEQKGSNITADRLRFDFNYPQKLTPEQLMQVEEIVNTQIERALPVSFEVMSVADAKERGAIGLFEDKYGDQIKVYKMGDFSFEICGGPHVKNTADLKSFKISKEEASSAGIRRIKAIIGK